MSDIVLDEDVQIPGWVVDLGSFRRWANSDTFPERGRFSHLGGKLWVDLSMENIAHNKAKTKIGSVLCLLVEKAGKGSFLGDGMLLTNVGAELSTEPDGMFYSDETVRAGRIREEHGAASVEVEGSPDMVLEVVSPRSVR